MAESTGISPIQSVIPLTSAAARGWQIGQLLHVTAASATRNGVATLRVGAELLQAHTSMALRAGEALTVVVAQLRPVPVLQVAPAVSTAELALTQALRTDLPRQQPWGVLLGTLGPMLAPGGAGEPAVAAAAWELLRRLADRRSVQRPEGLRAAVAHSGLLLEHHLAGGRSSAIALDLKAALLRLLQSARADRDGRAGDGVEAVDSTGKRPATLIEALSGVLARIRVQQLSSVRTQEGERAIWQLDLPVRDGDDFQEWKLRFEREPVVHDGRRTRRYRAEIHVEFEPLGPLHGVLSLLDDAVSVQLWAERAAIAARMARELSHLRARLQEGGLRVQDLSCRCGAPPPRPQARAERGGLVSERT